MKIIAIGRNYAAHASELGNQVPGEPLIFMKPETAILDGDRPFIYPEFSKDIHYELELIVRISCKAKKISRKDYLNYFDRISLGIDFTARDLQKKCKEKGRPWEIAKAFDGSAAIGRWTEPSDYDLRNIYFELLRNEKTVQRGHSANMIFPLDYLMEYITKFFTLEPGDIIFTGTPEGVGPVLPGDRLRGLLEGKNVLNCEIKGS